MGFVEIPTLQLEMVAIANPIYIIRHDSVRQKLRSSEDQYNANIVW